MLPPKGQRKGSGKFRGLNDQEEKCSLAKYETNSQQALVKTTTAECNLEKYTVNVSKKQKESQLKKWKEIVLHEQFMKTWETLRKGELKRGT